MRLAWPIAPALIVVVPFSMFGLLRADGLLLFITAGVAILACSIAVHDPWAGVFSAYTILRWLTPPHAFGLETTLSVVFGIGLLVAAQQVPKRWDQAITMSITIAAIAQTLMATAQWYGYDPMWLGWQQDSTVKVHGTFGNPMYMGSFVAIAAGVAPLVTIPVLAWGIILSKSATAGLAFGAAVLVRWRRHWRMVLPVAITVLASVMYMRTLVTWTWRHRAAIWVVALAEWWRAPLFGYGPGGWIRAWPRVGSGGSFEIYAQAHNEYLQLLFDGGLVGLALFGAWVWSRRKALRQSAWTPAVAALAMIAVGFFPFQVSGTAVLSLAVLGLATRREEKYEPFSPVVRAVDSRGGLARGCD